METLARLTREGAPRAQHPKTFCPEGIQGEKSLVPPPPLTCCPTQPTTPNPRIVGLEEPVTDQPHLLLTESSKPRFPFPGRRKLQGAAAHPSLKPPQGILGPLKGPHSAESIYPEPTFLWPVSALCKGPRVSFWGARLPWSLLVRLPVWVISVQAGPSKAP